MTLINDVGTTTFIQNDRNKWEASWEVMHFAAFNIVKTEIASSIFSTTISNKVVSWRIKVCKGSGKHPILLSIKNISEVDVLANFHVKLMTRADSKFYMISKLNKLLVKDQDCNLPELTYECDVAEYLKLERGTLKISWDVFKAAIVDTQLYRITRNNNRIRELDDYEKLLDDKESSDVTFVVGGKKILLHKAILRLKSPVFQAMFQHEMKEKKENLVKINDIQHDVMLEVFRFMYVGKVNAIGDKVKALYLAADKYSVTGLKTLCEKYLYKNLRVENVVEYLNLTVTCSAVNLRAGIIDFVVNTLDETSKQPEFKLLPSEVMYEIIRAIAEKKNKN